MPLFKRSPAKAAAAAPANTAAGPGGEPKSEGSGSCPIAITPSALAFSSTAADQEQARTLTISNRSPTLSCAFKIKCSNRDAFVVDCASGVLGPLGCRRVRVFRLAGGGRPPPPGGPCPPPPDAFCVTALALPLDTPLPEAAAAALTGRMGDRAVDVLLPVCLAAGLAAGGPPPEGVALVVAGAAAAAAPADSVGPLLCAFATFLASKGLLDDLGGGLAAAGEVVEEAARRRARGGGAGGAAPPPTPPPAEQQGVGVAGGGDEERAGGGGPSSPTPAAVPAFAARVARFEGGGLRF